MSGRTSKLDRRVELLEKKIDFTMNTLSVTRKDYVGTIVSQSFETLFQMAVKRDKDLESMDTSTGVDRTDAGSTSAAPPQSAPGPDGFPGEDRAGAVASEQPASGDIGRPAGAG